MSNLAVKAVNAVNAAKIFGNTTEITFAYTNKRGETSSITIWVYEECITPDFISNLQKFDKETDTSALALALSEAIESWSLTYQRPGEDSVEFEPTFVVLKKCPLSFLTAAVMEIIAVWRGDEKKSEQSQNTSEA